MGAELHSAPERFTIADLVLDTGSRQLWRGREEIPLPALSFDLMVELARAAPNALTVDELMDRVWSGVVVSPATVAKRVELLRQALADDSRDPRYVALVRGHGYRLVAKVKSVRPAPAPRYWPLAAGIMLLAAIALGLSWPLLRSSDPVPAGGPFADSAPANSIAVLPFVSMSADPEDEFFADGLTEELNHALANISALKVTGRTSSFYYKGRDEDLRSIGEALGVAHVLEGSVRRGSDKVRITAQLIKTADGFHMWSQTYDRTAADILDIQEDIARNVVLTLRQTLLKSEEGFLAKYAVNDPETYTLYLKALKLSYGGPDSTDQARALLEQVVERDPDFVPAWNRLANVHGRSLVFFFENYPYSWEEGWQRVTEAIDRVLTLDPENGPVQATVAATAWLYEGDLVKAASHFERALELNPGNLEIIQLAISFAKHIGRLEEALVLEEYLLARDPLCQDCRYALAKTYRYLERLDEAEENIRTFQELQDGGGEWTLGLILLLKGNSQGALDSFTLLDHHEYLRLQGVAMALHDLGRQEEFEATLMELQERWGEEQPSVIAQVYAYTRDLDAAFEWLEKATLRNWMDLRTDFQEPLFKNLHGDPRWQALLERIGTSAQQLAEIEFAVELPATPGATG